MAITRYRPLSPLSNIQDDINRVFDQFWNASLDFPMTNTEQVGNLLWTPRVDISEDPQGYRISAELPGVRKEDIQVNVENGILTLEGERRQENERDENREGVTFHRTERAYGRFYRSFRLPMAADQGNVDAMFNNGILNLYIPKTEAARPRQIEIKGGEGQAPQQISQRAGGKAASSGNR